MKKLNLISTNGPFWTSIMWMTWSQTILEKVVILQSPNLHISFLELWLTFQDSEESIKSTKVTHNMSFCPDLFYFDVLRCLNSTSHGSLCPPYIFISNNFLLRAAIVKDHSYFSWWFMWRILVNFHGGIVNTLENIVFFTNVHLNVYTFWAYFD